MEGNKAQDMAGLSWTPVVNNDYTEGNVSDRWVPQQQMPTDPRFTVEVVDDYDDDEPPELETEDVLVWKSGSAGECVNDICLVAQEEDDLRTQALQLLAELEETRELALKHEQSFVELQGILEDERLASAQQAEIFTKQIQNLQGQLRSVQEEIDSLEEEKESELQEVEDELKCAQEEILALRTAAEDAAAERENDIATLQEELCRLRAELVKLQQTRDEYELEITTLRAEIQMKSCGHQESEEVQLQGELQALREQCQQLRGERRSLLESNNLLRRQLHEQAEGQQLGLQSIGDSVQYSYKTLNKDGSITEAEEEGRDTNDNQEEGGRETPKMESEQNEDEPRTESISAWRQGDTSLEERGLPPLLEEEEEEEVQEASCVHLEASTKVMCHKETPKTQRDDEGFGLRQQLQSAEEKVQRAQNECEGLLTEFQELQLRHRLSQEEQEKLQEELKQCREEIHRLKGSSSQGPSGVWTPLVVLAIATAAVILYPGLKKALD
ncbi:coiled-coil domain-containing protein 136 isoform X2 [Pleurodeles waltl]|uniref:coiled-coil domain-containing protein 136 isoform X2 n=1 Tax=Pleurodeles waltl TaxID=8319 RepID=UPI0037096216